MSHETNQLGVLFNRAIEQYARDPWSEFVDGACGGDVVLRQRVERLPEAHQGNDRFPGRGKNSGQQGAGRSNSVQSSLAETRVSGISRRGSSADGLPATVSEANPDSGPSSTQTWKQKEQTTADVVIAGRDTLVEWIGEGGMGEVRVAGLAEPVKRKVASNLIGSGWIPVRCCNDSSRSGRRRR